MLDGQDRVALASHVIAVSGLPDGSQGWRLTISATQFVTSGSDPYALPITALSVGQGSGQSFLGPEVAASSIDAGEIAPRNSLDGGQVAVPTTPLGGAATATAPAFFFSPAAGTGAGSFEIEVPYSLYVPANAHAGVYTATVTITQLGGP